VTNKQVSKDGEKLLYGDEAERLGLVSCCLSADAGMVQEIVGHQAPM